MTTKTTRVIKQLKITDSNEVFIRLRGSSELINAKILDMKTGEFGEITYLLLDRLIHRQGEDQFDVDLEGAGYQNPFMLAGCYVSELSREAR